MTQLHAINGPNGSPDAYIVFAHGLGANYLHCWCHDPEYPMDSWPFWTADLFPKCQVLLLDYESEPTKFSGSGMPLYDQASNICSRLDIDLEDGVPIIFVAHSLGGLLIKKILQLNYYHRKDWSANLASMTKGVVFIATLHGGSLLADCLARISKVTLPNPIMSDLKSNVSSLRELDHVYGKIAADSDFETLSFYETKPTKLRNLRFFNIGTKVVQEKDAIFNGPRSCSVPIDADHIEISKPSGRNSILCGTVFQLIQSIVGEVSEGSVERSNKQSSATKSVRTLVERGDGSMGNFDHIYGQFPPQETPGRGNFAGGLRETGRSTWNPPMQVASTVSNFEGRGSYIAQLLDILCGRSINRKVALDGMGGVGKTELARNIASKIGDVCTGGQIEIDVLGTSDSPLSQLEIARRILQTYKVEVESIEDATISLNNLPRDLFLILDDVQGKSQIEHVLCNLPESSYVVITSRNIIHADNLENIHLDFLNDQEAIRLFKNISGLGEEYNDQLL